MTRRVTGGDGTPTSRRDPHARGREPTGVSPPSPACDRDLKSHYGDRQGTQSMTPADLTAEARTAERAGLLGRAALRLRRRAALPCKSAPGGPESPQDGQKPCPPARNPLDLLARQSVHGGVVNAPEEARSGGSA